MQADRFTVALVWQSEPTGLVIDAPPGRRVSAAGVDLCDAGKLGRAVARTGAGLAERVFDERERAACAGGADLAATALLFGVKESVIKLVGGLPSGAAFRDIRIGDSWRLPVTLTGGLAGWAATHPVEIVAGGRPLPDLDVVLCWALATEEVAC
jgi:phosphopantetheinyl transferase (holo-ACP synthase)